MSEYKGRLMGNITPGTCGSYCYYSLKVCCSQSASLLLQRLGVRGSVCQMAQQAGRPAARGAQEEIRAAAAAGGGGGCCHFKVCALLSWSAPLCNSHIIIRGRPRPAACQPLNVWSSLLQIFTSGVGLKCMH